jgi:hypothetical protein
MLNQITIPADVSEWLKNSTSNFAQSLGAGIARYGSLTERQIEAVRRIIAEAAQKAAAATQEPQPVVAAPALGELQNAFLKAQQAGLKYPKLRTGVLVFSPAGANSSNPGAIYIKRLDTKDYLGKITPEGAVRLIWAASQEDRMLVNTAVHDPLAAAVAHGRLTGNCAICSRPLTDRESVGRGIGPICAEKFGW